MARKRNPHTTERRWRTLLTRLERSGQSVAEFAARHGVSTASVYHWRKRLRRSGPRASARVYCIGRRTPNDMRNSFDGLTGGTFELSSAPDSQHGIEITPVDPTVWLGGIDLRSAKRRKRYARAV